MPNDLAKGIMKLHQPCMFSGKGRSGEIGYFAVIFMQAHGSAKKRAGSEVALDEFLRDRFIFLVRRLEGEDLP